MVNKYILLITYLLVATFSKKSSTSTAPLPAGNADTSFVNPLLQRGPDPWVEQKDTMYYFTHTFGDHIAVYATSKMSDLKNAKITTIWTPPASGMYSKEIWAPEIHYIENKWYAYFAADDGRNDNHRIYALQCDDPDPMKGAWTFKGKIADTDDKWAIDASVFEYKRQLYMVWSGWQGDTNIKQDIYIARMSDPLTIQGQRVKIASPTYSWEGMGGPPSINEGPEALINGDKLFLTFSASACWTDDYSLGLLTLKDGGDPMTPSDWTKSPAPVFSGVAENGAFAPGHNGFFKSRDGKEDWLVYHANLQSGQGCRDARNPRMQRFSWNADGSPDFGAPVKVKTAIRKPGGE